MFRYDWKKDVIVKKKMLLRARTDKDLLLSLSGEYEDSNEWFNQFKYWNEKHNYRLSQRRALVKCQHVAIMDGDIVPTASGDKVYIFPREQVTPLDYDEVDRLLEVV